MQELHEMRTYARHHALIAPAADDARAAARRSAAQMAARILALGGKRHDPRTDNNHDHGHEHDHADGGIHVDGNDDDDLHAHANVRDGANALSGADEALEADDAHSGNASSELSGARDRTRLRATRSDDAAGRTGALPSALRSAFPSAFLSAFPSVWAAAPAVAGGGGGRLSASERRAVAVAVAVHALQQATGINAVMFYAELFTDHFAHSTQLAKEPPLFMMTLLATMALVASTALPAVVER
eukprot:533525-Pleurochrysis_carterae.AAC.1